MANVTTAQLFSYESVKRLVVDPTYADSHVLPYLTRYPTRATTVYLPTVSGGTAGWYAELSPIADAGVVAAEVEVTPKKVAALQTVSNESLSDANAATLVGKGLVGSLAAAVDKAFALGAGATGPAGLPGIAGTSSVDGAPTDLASIAKAIATIQTAGGAPTVLFMSPADWAEVSVSPATAGGGVPALTSAVGSSMATPMTLLGVRVSVLKDLTAGTAWMVDGGRTIVVDREPATVDTNDGPVFASDGTMVRATMRLEFASLYPPTVCKIFDAP